MLHILIDSVSQEGYMEVVNPFILKNKERMIVFLDQLSQITDPYTALTGLDLVQNANNQTDTDTGEISMLIC